MASARWLFVLALGAVGACATAPPITPEPVVAAERAFAADGLAHGVKVSFLKHSAADAIVIQPDPVNAHANLAKAPDLKPGEKRSLLVWWPLWAGIATSGDLGFTTGPFTLDGRPIGHYFTVWKKQADGSWKWVFDGGCDADPTGEPPPGAPAAYLPLATARSSSPEAATAEVAAAEVELARRAASDLAGAYLVNLADDGRLHTAGIPPARGRAAFAGALSKRSQAMELAHVGGGASLAGDLVWTYGDARWTADGQAKRGHYVRVWQKRLNGQEAPAVQGRQGGQDGWRIVFDQLLPYRGPP